MCDEYFEGETFQGLSISEETIANCEFVDCQFVDCSFENCKIIRCGFSECVFRGCTVSGLKIECSEAKFLEFDDCVLIGINWSLLKPAGRFGSVLHKLTDCKLRYNTFSEMSFSKFSFSTSSITGSTFAECDLSGSSFFQCDLSDTEFFKCDIRNADFREAAGYKIDVLSSRLKAARFSYPEVSNLLYSLEIKIE